MEAKYTHLDTSIYNQEYIQVHVYSWCFEDNLKSF